jgi:phosphoribosylformimino-5-aminoimidazole carboxamide ribotide isomerase
MSPFTIFPAIDLRGGKVVRLKEGDPARMTSYSDNPAEMAKHWLEIGTKWLHVINLDGAFGEHDHINRSALESILKVAKSFGACVQFGGGLRSLDTIECAMDAGVDRIVLGTIAVTQPAIVADALTRFGADQIAVGIDARDGWVRVHGWKDNSGIAAADLALQMKTIGLDTVIFTDVSRDGLGGGLNIDATRALAEVSGLNVIASGGVHTLEDVMAAQRANLSGVIIGRAIYEGSLNLKTALQEVTDAR